MKNPDPWESKFDWYAATIPVNPHDLASRLLREYPDSILRPSKPKNGAGDSFQLCLGDMVIVTAIWGGAMEGHGVHAWASGGDAPRFAEVVRSHWPDHRVSRMDVAFDADSPEAFDLLVGKALEIADRMRVKVSHQGDWHRGQDGRSLYLGSKNSVVQLVIYEKGKHPDLKHVGKPNWVRAEVRIKPQKDGKGFLSGIQPQSAWGCSSWSKEFGEWLHMQDLPRLRVGSRWSLSDHERAKRALIRQYRNVIGVLVQEQGSPEAMGAHLWDLCQVVESEALEAVE